jgi:hypothetical protein
MLTRILTIYKDNLLARHAAVSFLLGEEEKLLRATLHTVHVVVHVEEGHSEREAGDDDTVHLTGAVGVKGDSGNKHNLNHSESGHLGHHEALLDSLDFFDRGGGILFHLSTVSGHFYYLQRK